MQICCKLKIKVNYNGECYMSASQRRMKPYHPRSHPRKSSHTIVMYKQQMEDLEKKISMDLGSFLVLSEEGTSEQTAQARQKARNDLIKFGPDMQKLAEEMGGTYPKTVGDFLDSVEEILHSAVGWIDEAKIAHCYHVTEKLEKQLHS